MSKPLEYLRDRSLPILALAMAYSRVLARATLRESRMVAPVVRESLTTETAVQLPLKLETK